MADDLADFVIRRRERKGWDRAQLHRELVRLGVPIHINTLGKIETEEGHMISPDTARRLKIGLDLSQRDVGILDKFVTSPAKPKAYQELSRRLAVLEASASARRTRLDQVETRLDRVETALDRVESRLDQVLAQLERLAPPDR